jgi:hypothetical protein
MADVTVKCRDEMGDGEWLMELGLPLDAACMTVRELVAARVETETAQHNAELDRGRQFHGLITAAPSVTSELNGWDGRRRQGKPVEGDVMLKIALDAYEAGDLVLLIDGEPAGALDSEVTVGEGTVVLFRKMKPLVVPQLDPGRIRTSHELNNL